MGRRSAVPTGLPGEQREARERRALLVRRVAMAALALAGWALLVWLVGPSRPSAEPPSLGPARRDIVALRDFDDQREVADLAERLDRAAAAVPIHYAMDAEAAQKRIDGLHAAFRLVRPRYRLLLVESQGGKSVGAEQAKPLPQTETKPGLQPGRVTEEMLRLRPEFEAMVAVRHGELRPETFDALLAVGFAEEVELLLADVAQVLLSQRIVRDQDRLDEDLQRGVLDTSDQRRYGRAAGRPDVLTIDEALRSAEVYVTEFTKQKKPSRLDDAALQGAVRSMARSMVDSTWTRDMAATRKAEDAARAAVPKTRTVHIAQGQAIVKRGELVTAELQASVARMWRGVDPAPSWHSYVATAMLLGLALALFGVFARRHLHHFRHRPRDAALLAAILLVHTAVLRALIAALPFLAEAGVPHLSDMALVALPHALGPALATLFLRPFTAAPFALLSAVVAALMVHNAPLSAEAAALMPLVAVLALVTGLAGVQAARRFRERADLAAGTLLIATVSAVSAVAAGLLASPSALHDVDTRWLWLAGLGASAGVLTYLLLAAVTPLFEMAFNRLTDIKLVELASMNHPALRLLATEAPGTFTHSVMVGNLAQSAAEAIGANGLLARVGAYYHDLGKTRAPRYFAENQSGDNPHDRLKPHLSALVIKSHVKDGIKILQEFGLPDEIIDFVPQHHGTSLIAHFYHRAQREAADGNDEVQEADFRYPGPKPQRKETALLMLADAVEAAAKALPEPNAVRIQAVVKRVIATKTEDGQFDECDLTLRELALVEAAFVKALVGMHHARPVYLPAPSAVAHPAAGQSAAGSAAATLAPTTAHRDGLRETARDSDRELALKLVQTQPMPEALQRTAGGWSDAATNEATATAPESPTAVISHTSRRS